MNLPLPDATIVAVLLGGLIGVGYWARRLTRSVSHFTVAGREVGMWLGLDMSMLAEGIGLISIANACQQGFVNGFSVIWLNLGGLLLIDIPLFGIIGLGIKRYRATNVQTLPQFYEMRYGRAVRIFAGITLALGGVLNMAIFPIVGSQFLTEFLNIPNRVLLDLGFYQFGSFHLVLFIVLSLACFFTMIGGMMAVILTDYIQSILIFISITVISVLILKATGLSGIREAIDTHLGDAAFNPLSTRSIGPVFVVVFLLGAVTHRLAFPPSLQKMSAAKSPEVVRKMFLLSTIFGQGRGMLLVVWGVGALALFGPAVPEGYGPEIYHRVVGARMIRTLTDGVPLLKGVALAGFVFAFISTVDSYMLSWASLIGNDCICAIRRKRLSSSKHVALLRWCSIGIAGFIFFFGCWYDPKQTILQYFYLTGVIFGACGLLTWFGLYWRRSSPAGAWACLVLGIVVPASWFVFQKHFPGGTDLPPWVNDDSAALAGTVLPALALIVVSLLTRPKGSFVDYGKKLKEMAMLEMAAEQATKDKCLPT
jgi:SSS family solute:Na+ symporter